MPEQKSVQSEVQLARQLGSHWRHDLMNSSSVFRGLIVFFVVEVLVMDLRTESQAALIGLIPSTVRKSRSAYCGIITWA